MLPIIYFTWAWRVSRTCNALIKNEPSNPNSNPTYLKLNLGLSNILLTSAAVGNLGSLSDLGLDGLGRKVFQSVALGGVDAHGGVGLDGGESTRNYMAR
jgi:hypothetical protein